MAGEAECTGLASDDDVIALVKNCEVRTKQMRVLIDTNVLQL